MNVFILDACALLAVLAMEKGAETIRSLFQKTADGQAVLIGQSRPRFFPLPRSFSRKHKKTAALSDSGFQSQLKTLRFKNASFYLINFTSVIV